MSERTILELALSLADPADPIACRDRDALLAEAAAEAAARRARYPMSEEPDDERAHDRAWLTVVATGAHLQRFEAIMDRLDAILDGIETERRGQDAVTTANASALAALQEFVKALDRYAHVAIAVLNDRVARLEQCRDDEPPRIN